MQPLAPLSSTSGVSLAAAAAALALPPGQFGLVPSWWSGPSGVVPELELEIWAPSAVAMTAAILYAAALHPLVYADQTVTSAAATDKITKAGHGLLTGDGPFMFTNVGGALSPELVGNNAGLGFWFVKVDANTGKLATSLALALAGTTIDLTADGTGTTTISDVADTSRVYWHTHDGLLGLAGDGAIALSAQGAYRKRVPHSPRAIAYALIGTLDTATVSAQIVPIQDL